MRNVQVWSVVAALIVANCCFGQLLRSRRQCCQPVCQSCSCVSNTTYTATASTPVAATPVYAASTPVFNQAVSYGEVISQPVYAGSDCSTCSGETQIYSDSSMITSGAIYETPVQVETPANVETPVSVETPASVETPVVNETPASVATPVNETSSIIIETPVVSTQSYEVPAATAIPVYQSATPVAPVSFVQPAGMTMTNQSYTVKSTPQVTQASYSASYGNANSDQMRVLSVVNRKRQRSGLAPLRFDPNLATVAQRKSYYRASRGMTGHDGTNMGGASVEGVGFSYGQADPVEGFNTCYLYSNGYQSCGCAVSYDANNRAYYTLLLR